MVRFRSLLVLMSGVLLASRLNAQVIIPLPSSADTDKRLFVYGLGSLDLQALESVSEFVANPAAKLALSVHPRSEVSIYASFNRGAGLNEIAADSFSIPSMLFPESGSTSFQGQLVLGLPQKVKAGLSKAAEVIGYEPGDRDDVTWDLGPFVEFAWESHGLKREDELLNIAGRFVAYGIRHVYRSVPEDPGMMRIAFGLGASYATLSIPRGAVPAFRTLVNEPNTATRYDSIRLKFFVQMNDLTAEAEYQSAGRRGQHDRVDVGGLTSRALDHWAYWNHVRLDFSRPGKPTDNAHIEAFNGSLRRECLSQHWFRDLAEATRVLDGWRAEYNNHRPHSSLANQAPGHFRAAGLFTPHRNRLQNLHS